MGGYVNKKQNKNKRAFTLTELLIVVIVIGVLSAVTLPKFNRVIENRKVTEAEEMMSAVRTEQERRCAMDKNYTLKFDNLADVISSSDTKNYKYSLQAEGISATSNKGKYTLKMLSYHDGSFCCTGDDCAKLNKNYPNCDGLTFPSSGCGGTDGTVEVTPDPITPAECTDGQTRGSQVCNTCGTQTTQVCEGGKWVNRLGACSKTEAECNPPECTDGAVSGSQSCNGCGTQTTKKCVSGKWTPFLGACSKTVEECTEPEGCKNEPTNKTKSVACNTVLGFDYIGNINYKWDSEVCDWKETSRNCQKKCDNIGQCDANFTEDCNREGNGFMDRDCSCISCETGKPLCPDGQMYTTKGCKKTEWDLVETYDCDCHAKFADPWEPCNASNLGSIRRGVSAGGSLECSLEYGSEYCYEKYVCKVIGY